MRTLFVIALLFVSAVTMADKATLYVGFQESRSNPLKGDIQALCDSEGGEAIHAEDFLNDKVAVVLKLIVI